MYENPSSPSSRSTAAAPGALRPWKGTAAVLNMVLVDPSTFRSLMFMGSAERKEFTREQMANAEKPQKYTSNGLPLWSVKVAVENWRGQAAILNVTVPMADDPATKFGRGQVVEFSRLAFGVADKRAGSYSLWWSADSINAAA